MFDDLESEFGNNGLIPVTYGSNFVFANCKVCSKEFPVNDRLGGANNRVTCSKNCRRLYSNFLRRRNKYLKKLI